MRSLKGWPGVVLLTLLVTAVLLGVSYGGPLAWLLSPRGETVPRLVSESRVALSLAWLGYGGPGTEHTRSFTSTVPVGTARALVLANVTGRVSVESSRTPGQVEVTAVKRAWGTADQARQALDAIQVQVEAGDDAVVVTTEPSRRWPSYSSVDYRVRVPEGFGVTVEAVTSEVDLRGVFDSATVTVVTGRVDLDIEAPVRKVTVKLVTGVAIARFTPVPGGSYELTVTTGTVAAEVPAAAGIDATLTVVSGSVSPGPGPWVLRASDGRRFEGTAAGGGANLTLTAVTGTVSLSRR